MYEALIERIRTTDEKDLLLGEIQLLLTSAYEADAGFDSTLKSKVRSWVSTAIKNDLAANQIGQKDYLEGLKKRLAGLKVLTLILAFEPTDVSIDKFIFFARENIDNDIILETQFDPKILGGVIIIFQGRYKDFSLKKILTSEFEKRKGELISLVYKS